MLRRGRIPPEVDATTTTEIERTFLVVRMVRGAALLLFLVIALGAVVAKDWPGGVAVAIALTVALQAVRLVGSVRRYRHTATLRST